MQQQQQELKQVTLGFPTPNWKQTWTTEVAERELKGFKFTGTGWYLTKTDAMLVVPSDREGGEARLYEFCVWDADPREALKVIGAGPDQTPIAFDEGIRSVWPALLVASQEIIAYAKGYIEEAISKRSGAERSIMAAIGMEPPTPPAELPPEAPVMIPSWMQHTSSEPGILPHYHIGDFQLLIVSADEHAEFEKRLKEDEGAEAPQDLRTVPIGDGRHVAIFPSQHG